LKRLILFSFIVLIFISHHKDCRGWWFNKSDSELFAEALQSNNPRKVEKCLDKLIQNNDYSVIFQIRNHARKMIRSERNKIIKSNVINPEKIRGNLSPWIKIDKKAIYFFKRKNVKQEGKDNIKSLYHR
jgi:CRISPR/Cas system endoribonuclease Cas6 (RAMP superfamily)